MNLKQIYTLNSLFSSFFYSRETAVSICKNISHNLKEVRSKDTSLYSKLVEHIIVGPCSITDTEAETVLGIDSWQYNKSWRRRTQIFPVKDPEIPITAKDSTKSLRSHNHCKERQDDIGRSNSKDKQVKIALPKLETKSSIYQMSKSSRRHPTDCSSNNNNEAEATVVTTATGWKCPDLHSQFVLFSKFANSGSDGSQITLRWAVLESYISRPHFFLIQMNIIM